MSVFVGILFTGFTQILNSLSTAFLLYTNTLMDLCQLCFFLLHRLKPLEDTHHTELISISRTKILRKVSYFFEELFIDLIFLNVRSYIVQVSFLCSYLLFFFFYLFSTLLVSYLELFFLLVIELFFAIIQKYLLFLTFELSCGPFLLRLKLFLFDTEFFKSLFHFLFLIEILGFDFSLFLLDF